MAALKRGRERKGGGEGRRERRKGEENWVRMNRKGKRKRGE